MTRCCISRQGARLLGHLGGSPRDWQCTIKINIIKRLCDKNAVAAPQAGLETLPMASQPYPYPTPPGQGKRFHHPSVRTERRQPRKRYGTVIKPRKRPSDGIRRVPFCGAPAACRTIPLRLQTRRHPGRRGGGLLDLFQSFERVQYHLLSALARRSGLKRRLPGDPFQAPDGFPLHLHTSHKKRQVLIIK